jgi:hypothetical protein
METAPDLDYGGETWWEDSRNISALASWLLAEKGVTARQMYDVFEHPDECQILWDAFRKWVALADA